LYKIPLLKEYRLDKLQKCISCINENPFNRINQRNCILDLYPHNPKGVEHMEKSIFRGMAIPSLRHLGWIIGQGDLIRPSANAKLIIESKLISSELNTKILEILVFEMDRDVFQFIDFIKKNNSIQIAEIVNNISNLIEGTSVKQRKERISKWLSILEQCDIMISHNNEIKINEKKYNQIKIEIQKAKKLVDRFQSNFFQSYIELSKDSAGIVDIRECRESVSLKMLKNDRVIITENIFDTMLRTIPLETKDYKISFGRPMGAKEKLFRYDNTYFGTILIRFITNFMKKETRNE